MIDLMRAQDYYGYDAPTSAVLQPVAPQEFQAPKSLVSVVSASGATGCSTIALLLSWLAAQEGIPTRLIEADLQFGDYTTWLGLSTKEPSLADGVDAYPVGLETNLELYRAPDAPEYFSEGETTIGRMLKRSATDSLLSVADCGSYWADYTVELLYAAKLVLVVFDGRLGAVANARKAIDLCQRLGIPSTKIIAVYNRFNPRANMTVRGAEETLGVHGVVSIPDGKAAVEALVSTGALDELVATNNGAVKAIRKLLAEIEARLGLDQAEQPEYKRARRRK